MATFYNKFLKKQYIDNKKLQPVADRVSPFVAAANKIQRGGESINEPLILAGPKGNSYLLTAAQAVAAQANHGASNYQRFVSSFGQYHGVANVTAMAVAGGKTNAEAFLQQLTEVIESEVGAFTSVAARKLLGPIGGAIGRISDLNEGGADGEIQLTINGDALNFSEGMILQAGSGTGNGANTVRSGLGYVISTAIDADVTGTSTTGWHVKVATSEANQIAGTVGGPTGWVDNDYLFRNGDAGASDLSDAQIRSYQAWITLAAASDTYNEVVRSVDSRASGFRLTSSRTSGMSVLDRIQLLATVGRSTCGAMNATLCVIGPQTWQQLAQEAQSYGTLTFTENTKIGIKMLTIMTCNGPTQIMNEPHCLESDIWLFTPETIRIYHYDGFPALDDADGNEYLRQASSAGYEIRWHAFSCPTVGGRPHHNGRCDSGNT